MSEKNYSSKALNFILSRNLGLLSTSSKELDGVPFGSITPYDFSTTHGVVIYISLISQHYKNLVAKDQACLTVHDPFYSFHPQQHPRASLICSFHEAPKESLAEIQKKYESRFPESINYELAHNFRFFCGTPSKVRWIGGFGEIGWIEGETLLSSTADSIAYDSLRICNHMNSDHSDALWKLAGYKSPSKGQITMTNISETALTLRIFENDHETHKEVELIKPIKKSSEARGVIIEMLQSIR